MFVSAILKEGISRVLSTVRFDDGKRLRPVAQEASGSIARSRCDLEGVVDSYIARRDYFAIIVPIACRWTCPLERQTGRLL
jgi:hypothetical protein